MGGTKPYAIQTPLGLYYIVIPKKNNKRSLKKIGNKGKTAGLTSTSRTEENIQKVHDIIMFDRRRTIDELKGNKWNFLKFMPKKHN